MSDTRFTAGDVRSIKRFLEKFAGRSEVELDYLIDLLASVDVDIWLKIEGNLPDVLDHDGVIDLAEKVGYAIYGPYLLPCDHHKTAVLASETALRILDLSPILATSFSQAAMVYPAALIHFSQKSRLSIHWRKELRKALAMKTYNNRYAFNRNSWAKCDFQRMPAHLTGELLRLNEPSEQLFVDALPYVWEHEGDVSLRILAWYLVFEGALSSLALDNYREMAERTDPHSVERKVSIALTLAQVEKYGAERVLKAYIQSIC